MQLDKVWGVRFAAAWQWQSGRFPPWWQSLCVSHPTRGRDLCLLHNSANYCPGAALAAVCYDSQLKPVQDRAEDEAPVSKLVRLFIISVPFLSSERKGSLVHQSHLVQPVCDVRFCCLLAFFSTLSKSRQRCFEVKPSTLKSYPREQEQFDSKSR